MPHHYSIPTTTPEYKITTAVENLLFINVCFRSLQLLLIRLPCIFSLGFRHQTWLRSKVYDTIQGYLKIWTELVTSILFDSYFMK